MSSFGEKFPSLKGEEVSDVPMPCILKHDVEKHCLDKQKVKEIAKTWESGLDHIGLDLIKELELEL